jgi:N-methylhydantoinase A
MALLKVPSTPADPSQAIGEGIEGILGRTAHAAATVDYLGHGTTVATNALLEGKGSTTGVITTHGFRDLLELGRQRRPDLYDLQVEKPRPLARRVVRAEIPERVTATGEVVQPLDEEAVRAAVRRLRDRDVEAVAVCFLFSFLYPEHERRAAAIIAEEMPGAFLSLSHEVLAEFREYERLSTTVVNSFVGSVMSGYIGNLSRRVREVGILGHPFITQSNGGVISLDTAATFPVRTVLSGPAAGVVGALAIGRQAGFADLITFDMGGTSTDVALINGGACATKMEQEVSGYPIRTPMLDINTVGAGGGSIAWLDSGGHMKVGPQSAGAVPGPACYQRGGADATVTDANVALGILSRAALLGGEMPIDAALADRAIAALAARLGITPEETAQGIIDIATMNMARAIRVISVERGYDPRDYCLIAFGGAGPLHAARLARELEIPAMLVPTMPGILCAYGLLVADLRTDYSRTQVLPARPASIPALNECLDALERLALAWFEQERIAPDRRAVRRVADMRYVGQNYEISIPLPAEPLSEPSLPRILDAFHQAHDLAYGYAAPDEPVQFVTLRLEAEGAVQKPDLAPIPGGGDVAAAIRETRRAFLPEAGGWTDIPLIDRTRLGAGVEFAGPAVVEQMDSTTLVLPGQRVRVDPIGNLIITEANGR